MPRWIFTAWMLALVVVGLGACRAPEEAARPTDVETARAADAAYFADLEAFLKARGQLEHALGIDSLLRVWRHPRGVPPYRDSIALRGDALMMAMDSLTPAALELLRDVGRDVARMDWHTQPPAQAATAELVVIAEAQRDYNTLAPRDGFRSTVELGVQEVLKGALPEAARADGQILVRRRSGLTPGGQRVQVRGEYGLTPGRTYLLFLSNALYDYRWRHPDVLAAPLPVDTMAVDTTWIARVDSLEHAREHYYLERYQGTRTAWFAPEELAEIKAAIRRVDRVLEAARPEPIPPAARREEE